jgi:hypothetical protein
MLVSWNPYPSEIGMRRVLTGHRDKGHLPVVGKKTVDELPQLALHPTCQPEIVRHDRDVIRIGVGMRVADRSSIGSSTHGFRRSSGRRPPPP